MVVGYHPSTKARPTNSSVLLTVTVGNKSAQLVRIIYSKILHSKIYHSHYRLIFKLIEPAIANMPGHRDSTRTNSRRGDLPVTQTESSLYVNLKDRDATCVCCTATLAADSPCTSCDICSKWQCIDCSKMFIAQYKLLKGLENFTWICNICKPSLKSIKQLSDKMDEFTSAQSEMSATLANMKATITVAVTKQTNCGRSPESTEFFFCQEYGSD